MTMTDTELEAIAVARQRRMLEPLTLADAREFFPGLETDAGALEECRRFLAMEAVMAGSEPVEPGWLTDIERRLGCD